VTEEFSDRTQAAPGYDDAFSHVSSYFVPFLLRAARLESGENVLDVATGTGIAAALAVVGAAGSVVAADISPAMVAKARLGLGQAPNASVAAEDGQALSFQDETFDVVLCRLGLMFFPDAVRGLWNSAGCSLQVAAQPSLSPRRHQAAPTTVGSMLSWRDRCRPG
jgi:ubiquinone/menaquinone biosynthesis C-methylase UbiE